MEPSSVVVMRSCMGRRNMTDPRHHWIETAVLLDAVCRPEVQEVPPKARTQYNVFVGYRESYRDIFVMGDVFERVNDRVHSPLRNFMRGRVR
ncbi:hypothetical protein LCGC14_0709430 [marine sediment metagenome]|uniref:Uncharacterized protein n=1 Tax=marine sediment metagenome TaxID=412755 RepID=A0A0F9T1B6_9ZZZZ